MARRLLVGRRALEVVVAPLSALNPRGGRTFAERRRLGGTPIFLRPGTPLVLLPGAPLLGCPLPFALNLGRGALRCRFL